MNINGDSYKRFKEDDKTPNESGTKGERKTSKFLEKIIPDIIMIEYDTFLKKVFKKDKKWEFPKMHRFHGDNKKNPIYGGDNFLLLNKKQIKPWGTYTKGEFVLLLKGYPTIRIEVKVKESGGSIDAKLYTQIYEAPFVDEDIYLIVLHGKGWDKKTVNYCRLQAKALLGKYIRFLYFEEFKKWFNEFYTPEAFQIDREGPIYPNIGVRGVDNYANEYYL